MLTTITTITISLILKNFEIHKEKLEKLEKLRNDKDYEDYDIMITNNNFHNCFMFKIKNNTTNKSYSVKIFKNGSCIITGITNEMNKDMVLNCLKKIFGEGIVITDIKYIMINGTFKINLNNLDKLDLYSLKQLSEQKQGIKYSIYDPENYKGLIIKTIYGTITVFGTGSVIVSTNSYDNIDCLEKMILELITINDS